MKGGETTGKVHNDQHRAAARVDGTMKGKAVKDNMEKGDWRNGCHQTADRVTVMMHDVWKSKA
jgi:hypothetical protein